MHVLILPKTLRKWNKVIVYYYKGICVVKIANLTVLAIAGYR